MKFRSSSLIRACLTLAVSLIAASVATAELDVWNQEKVTAIAAELPPAAAALRQSLRQKPPATLGLTRRSAFFRLRDQVRSIETRSRRLHSNLVAGEGREETLPIYRQMIISVRGAARELNRIPTLKPIEQNIEVVADVLKRLRPFYEEPPII